MHIPLKDKIAVVTGASKGLGAQTAIDLAKAGASVVVNYASDRGAAQRVVDSIESDGGRAIAVQADVGKPEEVQHLFAESDAALGGRVDVLVNNAGVFELTPLENLKPESFHRIFDINVLGMMLCTQAAATRMPSGGSIINLSSVVSVKGFPASVVYSASKGAIDSATRVLASELGPRGIRVNAVNPGHVETEGTKAAAFMDASYEQMWIKMSALGRLGKPTDISSVIVFLASSASGWLSGETLFATGGVR